jgi:hemerythrin-like domain-containing protein
MSAANPIEVRDMAIVHCAFRNAYAESARLVRAAPTPSAERVTFLSDHIDFGIALLHHHHESEDELLYPILVERVPEQAGTTEEVAHEHELVQTALTAASDACAAWRQHPSAETGQALAGSLDELNTVLQPHLDDEEQKVVPLAAVTLTQAEWDAMGDRARAGIPRDKMAVAFGMLLEPLNEADSAFMKRQLPAPVRILYPFLIQRPWTKYASTLRTGT